MVPLRRPLDIACPTDDRVKSSPNNEPHGPIRADTPPTRILFLGIPLLVERAVTRASVRAAPSWQGGPETPGRLAGCPPCSRHNYLVLQGVVSTEGSLPSTP